MRRRNPAVVISTTRSCPHFCGGRPIRPASRSAGKSTSSVHANSAVVPPPSRSSRSRASPTRPPRRSAMRRTCKHPRPCAAWDALALLH
jgi:hypothetical protein